MLFKYLSLKMKVEYVGRVRCQSRYNYQLYWKYSYSEHFARDLLSFLPLFFGNAHREKGIHPSKRIVGSVLLFYAFLGGEVCLI